MNYNDTFIIAKDGFKCIAASAALMLFFMAIDADLFSFLSGVLLLVTIWTFRNPERTIPHFQQDSIVSVADGVIRSIETIEDAKGESSYKIVIKSGFLDASVLRVPFSCEVSEAELLYGARLNSLTPLSDSLNEQCRIVFGRGKKQVRVMHKLQISSVGIKNHLSEKSRAVQGARYGLMVNGKTTLILPVNSRVAVKVGAKVRAGETLIGFFS
ncbi:phosphatidylserine decarboxylase [Sulfurimonas sp. HSL3-7]|uniref:phosphatidylserine decarboxylase n=1 Tax=Sulfonitrofixus jiaomeiensis TaxID=3131938 RepID=UPI0031F8A8E7